MFENQTFETILQRMFNNLSDDIDKREGSVAYDMLAPKAAELAMAYLELDNVLSLGFATTTYGPFLDLKVGELGVTRLQPTKAEGHVVLTNDGTQLLVPSGTAVSTDSGIRFLTKQDAQLTNGTATVGIIAESPGLNTNVPANSIINIEMSNVNCNNPYPTLGGTDIETDEHLLARYLEKITRPIASGNVNQYRQWAMEVTGIGDAKVVPLWNGNGTVKVVLISTEKTPVDELLVKDVADHIESVRPIGANVTVISAVGKSINVSAQLTLDGKYTIDELTPVIEKSIDDYLKSIAFVDTDVKYARIGNIILNTDGVLDYSNLTLNGGTANLPLGDEETPMLGAVTLT